MIRRFSMVLALLVGTVLAPSSFIPAMASDYLRSPACVANHAAGVAKIGSASDGTALEVCIARISNSNAEVPPSGSSSKAVSTSKVICTSSTVTLRLGPPTFQTRTFRQTVCKGQSITIEVTNVLPPPKPIGTSSMTTNHANSISGSAVTNQRTNQDSQTLQPDLHRISPENITIAADTRLTFASLAKVHYKTTTVLGEQISVRFVPVSFEWSVDGPANVTQTTSAQNLEATFGFPGRYQVKVVVLFEPEFQIAGSTPWLREARGISSTAFASVEVLTRASVTPIATPTKPNPIVRVRGFARLAATDCKSNPGGAGCLG